MNRREIRTLLAKMRDQPPTQKTFHRLSGLGVPPVDKLRFVWPSLLIHRGRSGGTAIQNKWTRIRSSRPYIALVVMCWSLRHVRSTEEPCRPHGGAAGRVRPRDIFAASRTSPRSEVERWRELPDGAIEFTMRRLRTAD